jgi:protoporphyrin/coproporphyrin ferrochelatase
MATGILIGNLGTPQSPTPKDVKAYLSEFLMDKYVIDKAYWFRWLLVKGIIAPTRAKKSALLYKNIWTEEGSPLLVNSQSVVEKLQALLGDDYQVVLGMRYGTPSIRSALETLKDCESILFFPQYPQFADSSFTTWLEGAQEAAKELNLLKKVKGVVAPFFAHREYLASLEANIKQQLAGKEIDHMLFSFHGLPERHIKKLDATKAHCFVRPNCCDAVALPNARCYRAQSFFVAREMSNRLDLDGKTSVAFQSRLGRDPWIQPYTDVELKKIAQSGVKKLAVVMPAFTVDCLETLEEIHVEGAKIFKEAGGEEFYPLYCLNDDARWIEGLSQMIKNYPA